MLECWSDSIADLGLWIVEFYSEFDPIIIVSIRNLQSEIRNPLTPTLRVAFSMAGAVEIKET